MYNTDQIFIKNQL